MTTPLQFVAAVLPSPGHGYYCAVELTKKQHLFVENLDEIKPAIKRWLTNEYDIYFALATFKKAGSRQADNAGFVRAFFIDMDGYESKTAAATALGEFLDKTGLSKFGQPWMVSSGGGLHCYWGFDKDIPVEVWKPAAENFKRLCVQEKLRIDMTVTADAARVLRIPGTMNFKKKYDTPRAVRLLTKEEPAPIQFEDFAAELRSKLNGHAFENEQPVQRMDIEGVPLKPLGTSQVQLISNSINRFKTIMLSTRDGEGCAQLAHYVEHAQDDGMEPLWRGWLSITKYCTDGERASEWLSKLHPYDAQRMHTKLAEIKGPYPCVKFDSENPGICNKCKHFGSITNPLALGREIQVDNSVKEYVLPPRDLNDPDDSPVSVFRPPPPKGFYYGANGGVFCDIAVEDDEGSKAKKQIMVLPYDMFVVDLLNNEGEHTVHMIANRANKPIDVLMPQRSVVSKDDMLKALAQQNILSSFGATTDKYLFSYVRACVEEASTSRKAVRIPAQYGWQEDHSFVYSGRVFYPSGEERSVPMPDLANITRATKQRGTLESWRKFPEMLMRRELYDMLTMMTIGFASPLMTFTGLNALTFHAGSTESGTGKSLTLAALASIWGHPSRYRVGKSTSAVTMQQRCGNLNSLPFVSDEITHKSRHDMEWFPGLVFDLSEGQGKEKSDTYVNKERLNNVSWSLLSLLTSNMHMQDYMSGARKHSSQGELFRMLEWTPKLALNWSDGETAIIKSLNDNYGVAGEQWVRWLVKNREQAESMTVRVIERLKLLWKMSGDERYWAAGCGCIVAAATLLGPKYANILTLPIPKLIESLKALIDTARGVVTAGIRNADDVLNSYTRDNFSQFIIVKNVEGKPQAVFGDGGVLPEQITRIKVMGRIEHNFTAGHIDYFIEEAMLKAHCVALSYGYDDFKRQIEQMYRVTYMRKDMLARAKGPQMRVRAIHICRRIEDDPDAAQLSLEQS
jgi:hypothetical protein